MTATSLQPFWQLPSPENLENARRYSRLCWRVINASELQSELIVLMCLISNNGVYGRAWLTLEAVERSVQEKLRELPTKISLVKPVRWYLEKCRLMRLVECQRGSYRLTRVGLACVIDHSNRLTRHNAREWDKQWQEQAEARG